MTKFIPSLILTLGMLIGGKAHAADRQYCWHLKIKDSTRWNCPTPGTPGARRTCQQSGSEQYAEGWKINIFDRDNGTGSADDYIGTWHTLNGFSCASFAWEGASYAEGEAHPDLYFTIENEASQTSNGAAYVDIVQPDDSDYPGVSFRDFTDGECLPGQSCGATDTIFYPTTNEATDYGQAVLALDSAQRTLEQYGHIMDAGRITIEYPTNANCPTACAMSRTSIHIPSGLGGDAMRTNHEMGHVLQMQMFEQDFLGSDYMKDGSDGWSYDTDEHDKTATSEGYASYVAAVSWWDPANTGSLPFDGWLDFEDPTPLQPLCGECPSGQALCANNFGRAGQAAKAFWDLDDANNEAAVAPADTNDISNHASVWITEGWDLFPDGTSNHQDRESDANGVNLQDFDHNRPVSDSFMNHNCIRQLED